MKQIIFFGLFLIFVFGSCNRPEADITSFEWLVGKWVGKYDSVPIFEQWKPREGKVMMGRGGVLSGKDTVFSEKISIEQRGYELYYIAIVGHNREPAEFKFTGYKNDTAVFENPLHDFPQRVLYYKKSDGTVYASVDGKYKGKYVKEEFDYKKAPDW
jgi:hypothetical protein